MPQTSALSGADVAAQRRMISRLLSVTCAHALLDDIHHFKSWCVTQNAKVKHAHKHTVWGLMLAIPVFRGDELVKTLTAG